MNDFQRSIVETIQRRTSCRSYAGDDIDGYAINRLISVIKSPGAPPFGSSVRFHFLGSVEQQLGRVRGTYGVVRGARNYIVGAVRQSAMDMEDFGFLFERIILLVTELDLGTCWMGGTFNRSRFVEMIDIGPDEIIPAVSPVGYPAQKRTLVDSAFRIGAGSKRRKAWPELFFERDFHNPLSENDRYLTPLEMVRLGPSASNNQPWRIVRIGNGYHFFLQRTKGYRKLFRVDLQRIDMGIAMCHFQLTAGECNLPGKWSRKEIAMRSLPERTEYIVSWECDE